MKPIILEEWAVWIEDWKVRKGITGRDYVQPNSGISRTPEKKELLRQIEESAIEQGRVPPFKANY